MLIDAIVRASGTPTPHHHKPIITFTYTLKLNEGQLRFNTTSQGSHTIIVHLPSSLLITQL
ncbi:hypothetical protein EA147_09295 [Providencia stuartii]|uniref:Uncharacterized protein n=1 Tax=Providencia stuartii ATCC 25827 TaxID=471874 RepID=A0AA86YZ46_PROST|nr:hypothetical protein AM353_03020 [Providencia stuartii]EDU60923.1 hypothetical protein PROSTU_01073 [Providencia stuartii ATCC 25827]EDU61046.1 hypothetical protein PROSTU_01027 [Providencia stuartii ATCC 25827]EDU61821.1 hypothetical protein PROSTU_00165 [Providencia stuartii ATCC 25827]RMA13994.1 hypothetical protein EA147_09295 [Providencia stuartii]